MKNKEKSTFDKAFRASFEYQKEDGTKSFREVLNPKFIKESYNYYNSFDKENVKYVQGYEIESKEMTQEDRKLYEETVLDYFNLTLPTLEEFLKENGLDPSKVKIKNFKKENINQIKIN
jgi:hypothetical protein